MKRRLGLFLAVLMGFAVIAGLAVQDDQALKQEQRKNALDAYRDAIDALQNQPQEASSANWMPLTANVGIVLKPTISPGRGGKPAFLEYSGTLMYRPTLDHPWQVLILDNPGLHSSDTAEILADSDFKVAEYYVQKRNNAGAIMRLKNIIDNYPAFSRIEEVRQLYERLQNLNKTIPR